MAKSKLTLSYSGSAGRWTGVLRDGRDVLVECGHTHKTRDIGQANASKCIANLLYAAYRHNFTVRLLAMENAREITARSLGARVEPGAFAQEGRLRIAAIAAATEGREVRHGAKVLLAEDGRLFNEWGIELPA